MEQINDFLDHLSKGKFIALQVIVGLLIAVAGGCCVLFLDGGDAAFNSYGLAGALIICGGLPTLLRTKIQRATPWLRWSIIGGLVIYLGVYVCIRFP